MIKWNRVYELDIETKDGSVLTVTLPLSCEFDIQRSALSSANVADFKIYNLTPNNRAQIQKNLNDIGDLRTITFKAGYGFQYPNLPTCFTGMISQCYSYKQGRVDIVTEIQSFDGGFAFGNGPTQAIPAFAAGTPRTAMIQPLLSSLPGNNQGRVVQLGAVGSRITGTLSRANSFSGHPLDVLKQMTGGPSSGFFIDLGKAYLLSDNECIPADGITKIDASSGLLETPIWEQSTIHFPMLMETRLIMAQRLSLVSSTNPTLNHDYKVISLGHRGMISAAVCGEAITNVGLFAPLVISELVDIPA